MCRFMDEDTVLASIQPSIMEINSGVYYLGSSLGSVNEGRLSRYIDGKPCSTARLSNFQGWTVVVQ